ncbi:hypothetical protein Q9L58_006251 [Maublancomyces gigas]|uniref:DUF7708 domain-containing protein n=1 Tax=Discina gigas TaxID=1032678 RepID=A0ABR3GG31_9PEZI
MSASGPSSATANYQTVWAKALEHLNQLSPEQQKFYNLLSQNEKELLRNGSSPDDILHLLQKAGISKHSRFSRFSERFAKPLYQFQGVFEVMSSTNAGIGAPIWAPIKLVLQMVKLTSDEFSKIDTALSDMLRQLELFRKFEEHFKPSASKSWDHLYDALGMLYIDVIDFTLIAAKRYRTGTLVYTMRRVVRTFDSDFGDVMSSMKRHLDSIVPAAQLAGLTQSKAQYQDLSYQIRDEVDVNAKSRLGTE